MPNLTTQSVVRRSDAVLFTDIEDSMSLMDMDSGQYFDFDLTGAQIWKLIDGERSVSEICGLLQEDFDVTPASCQTDTLEFLHELERRSLVSAK